MSAFIAGQAGMVGKLPARAEYLPVPSTDPAFAIFDGWLTEAIEWAAGRAGPGWNEAFEHGAMHGFVFRPPAGAPDGVLCGALAPSRDSAGRAFPLALAAPLRLAPELVARPELLPFALEGLWAEATELLAASRSATVAGAPALHGSADIDASEAAQLYDEWAAELPLVELWSLLGSALGSPDATLRVLLETLAPARGTERPQTTLSLRLPLGMAGGAALCFWLDVVRRSLGWTATVPSLFWSHDGSDGSALLHLGRPPKDALAELWLPTGSRDDIVDLTAGAGQGLAEVCAPLTPALSALIETPGATVAQLLSSVLA